MGVGDSINLNTMRVLGKVLLKPLGTDFLGICMAQYTEISLSSGWNQNQGSLGVR